MIEVIKEIICISAVTFFTVTSVSIILVGLAIVITDRHLK